MFACLVVLGLTRLSILLQKPVDEDFEEYDDVDMLETSEMRRTSPRTRFFARCISLRNTIVRTSENRTSTAYLNSQWSYQ